MPKGHPKTQKTEKMEVKDYQATLEVNGEVLLASGNTALEVLNGLMPSFYKTKGVLTIVKGDKRLERVLYIPVMKRLFNEFPSLGREVAREQMAKIIELMLK